MNYHQALDYINSFTVSGRPVHSLSRISALLDSLGSPQKALEFVHIAGTNGKGSALEMISCGLMHSGRKTGQLTSPFIRHYRDRIRINGTDIPQARVSFFAEKIKNAPPSPDCSQFEITLALALMYFAEENCGIVCLEVGLGGLLDATNCIEKPAVSVIMSISRDHTAILGDTLAEIAFQKAGIIKKGCPCVLYPENSADVKQILTDTAQRLGSPCVIPDSSALRIKTLSADGSLIEYQGKEYHVAMLGRHQIFNALTAIEAMRILGLNDGDIAAGLALARVPARMQKLAEGLYFDGAHNPGGAKALASTLKLTGKKPVGICGMMGNKDYKACIGALADSFSAVICVDGFAPGALCADVLAREFTENGVTAQIAQNLCEALKMVQGRSAVVFGSLYLYEKLAEFGAINLQ